VSTVRERDIDAEGDPISTDHLVRQGYAEVGRTNSA
jgi:hypothetical protein